MSKLEITTFPSLALQGGKKEDSRRENLKRCKSTSAGILTLVCLGVALLTWVGEFNVDQGECTRRNPQNFFLTSTNDKHAMSSAIKGNTYLFSAKLKCVSLQETQARSNGHCFGGSRSRSYRLRTALAASAGVRMGQIASEMRRLRREKLWELIKPTIQSTYTLPHTHSSDGVARDGPDQTDRDNTANADSAANELHLSDHGPGYHEFGPGKLAASAATVILRGDTEFTAAEQHGNAHVDDAKSELGGLPGAHGEKDAELHGHHVGNDLANKRGHIAVNGTNATANSGARHQHTSVKDGGLGSTTNPASPPDAQQQRNMTAESHAQNELGNQLNFDNKSANGDNFKMPSAAHGNPRENAHAGPASGHDPEGGHGM